MAFGRGKKEKAATLFETGAKGVGTVLQVQDTGMTINDNPRVKMTFRVEPLEGGAPFDVEKKTTVSRVEIPRTGDRYPVWYDRNDPSTWAYATINDDNGRQQIRAMFGAAADSFVGVGPAIQAPPPGTGAPAAAPAADPYERLQKLNELRQAGAISDSEYEQQKAKLLSAL
jgi:hypothetical protein